MAATALKPHVYWTFTVLLYFGWGLGKKTTWLSSGKKSWLEVKSLSYFKLTYIKYLLSYHLPDVTSLHWYVKRTHADFCFSDILFLFNLNINPQPLPDMSSLTSPFEAILIITAARGRLLTKNI